MGQVTVRTKLLWLGLLFAVAVLAFVNGPFVVGRRANGRGKPSPAQPIRQLDSVDTLDTTTLLFVKVATRSSKPFDNEPSGDFYKYGFLLRADENSFTVRCLDLTERTFESTPVGTDESVRVGYTPQGMAEYARLLANQLQNPDKDHGYYFTPGRPMKPRGEAFLLARACEHRGLKAEAHALRQSLGDVDSAWKDVADGVCRSLVQKLADVDVSRPQLLSIYEAWLEVFGVLRIRANCPPGMEQLEELAAQLKLMVAEDKAGGSPARSVDITPEGLVFQLRDEFHRVDEHVFDGQSDARANEQRNDCPVARLIKLGHKAVPALLMALGDETPTRCVEYSSRFGGSLGVYTVGDLAEGTLEAISGLRFYGSGDERATQWRRWWNDVSWRGEVATLAERAALGGSHSKDAARRLISISPKSFEPVMAGARRAEDAYVRAGLIRLLTECESETVTKFLLEELRSGPFILPRVAAAEALLARGRTEGIATFIAMWQEPSLIVEKQNPGVPEAVVNFDQAMVTQRARRDLVRFLLSCGDPAAVSLVTTGVMKQPAEVREVILFSMFDSTLSSLVERAKPDHVGLVENAIESALAHLLDDKTVWTGSMFRNIDGMKFDLDHPRHCDIAACALSAYWPERYSFDSSGPGRLKDRRLVTLQNVWRQRQGLPSLPVEVEQPSGRHGNVVTMVTFTGDEQQPMPDLRRRVESLRGKPLTGASFVDLLLAALGSLPGRTGNVVLLADRIGDGSGVHVDLAITPWSSKGDEDNVSSLSWLCAGDRRLEASSGGGARSSYSDPEDYQDQIIAMDKAISLPEEKTFEFRIELQAR